MLLAVGALAPAVHAQGPAADAPAGSAASNPAPIVLQRGRFRILLATTSSLEWAREHDATSKAIARCEDPLHLDSAATSAATRHDPWADADSAALGGSELVVQVVGQPRSPAACGLEFSLDPGMIARGIALVAGRAPDAPRSVASIALQRPDSVSVEPLRRATSSSMYVGTPRTPAGSDDPVIARAYFPAGTVTPRRDGTFESMLLVIVSAWGDTTRVPIAGALFERLWPGVAAVRLAATGGQALSAAKRLASSRLTARDELSARLTIATELLTRQDTAAAAVTVVPSLRPVPELPAAPCLQLASSAPAALRKLIDDLRPPYPQRCAELGATRTMVRGLIIPGGSQLALGQRTSGYIVAGAVVAAGAGALALHQRANQQYRAYQAVTYPIKVPDAYRRANVTRHAVVTVLAAGAGVWAAAAIEGGIAAVVHDRDVRRVQNYVVSPVARAGAGGVRLGFAVSFGRGHS